MPSTQSEFEIRIDSEDKSLSFKESKALRNFLRDQDFADDIKVEQQRQILSDDDAGGELLSILSVMANAPVIGYLSQSLIAWIKSRADNKKAAASNLKFNIKTESGSEFSIDANNIGDNEMEIINRIIGLVQK